MKKALLAMAILFVVPTIAAPHCVVVEHNICFESQAQYDKYMGWGAEQQKAERSANK